MIVKAIKKALVMALENENERSSDKNKKVNNIDSYYAVNSQFSSEENPAKKIKELEALIFQLSGKITILVDKVHNMESHIVNLTTAHEELLHILDNNIEELEREEDKMMNGNVNSKESKFGLN